MKRLGMIAAVWIVLPVLGVPCSSAQSMDDLNLQVHGYATQGFLYSTNNNILTTDSSDGSPAWTEAVVNVSVEPSRKLHVIVQARYSLLGEYGKSITLDYASADYKVNDRFGVRFGKVKTPYGLFNEIQDIDPAYMWSLLPQSIYQISSRDSMLSHYGGLTYGTLPLGEKLGKLVYRGWGGERAIGSKDGYFLKERALGIDSTNGVSATTYGAALHWNTPLPGLTLGATINFQNQSTSALTYTIPGYGVFNGTLVAYRCNEEDYDLRYDKRKLMVAGEFSRSGTRYLIQVPGVFAEPGRADYRAWYGMASYKLTDKLSAGLYDSQFFDRQVAPGPGRFHKDWALSARYDFNQFLYAKAEQHFIDGTQLGYSTVNNVDGLKPDSRMTLLKLGVSF